MLSIFHKPDGHLYVFFGQIIIIFFLFSCMSSLYNFDVNTL